MNMNTYPEMNRQIVGLLRTNGSPTCLYAAARIEELEKQLLFFRNLFECESPIWQWEEDGVARCACCGVYAEQWPVHESDCPVPGVYSVLDALNVAAAKGGE